MLQLCAMQSKLCHGCDCGSGPTQDLTNLFKRFKIRGLIIHDKDGYESSEENPFHNQGRNEAMPHNQGKEPGLPLEEHLVKALEGIHRGLHRGLR
ncbi:hypothetical protein AMTR_s00077p00089880 [Amborella trichopoda]|uniref:Uncharacterized protein n=1 Tax=Amborella trichopoda TaxID=13333 RepID=W1P2W0_AMBTC|nr:hypothetical protein AMTR_s00077p00089880 [Amborella trichopoda]